MDLNVLAQLKCAADDNPAKGVFEGIMQLHGLLRKIELAGMDFKTKKGGKPADAPADIFGGKDTTAYKEIATLLLN